PRGARKRACAAGRQRAARVAFPSVATSAGRTVGRRCSTPPRA
ncbi:hypothetical protein BMAJHU_I0262, partial [Burkholderia mallei JHU]